MDIAQVDECELCFPGLCKCPPNRALEGLIEFPSVVSQRSHLDGKIASV